MNDTVTWKIQHFSKEPLWILVIVKYFMNMFAHMNACKGRMQPINWSLLWPFSACSYVWMYWPLVTGANSQGATDRQTGLWPWMCECFECIPFRCSLAFPECGPISISMYLSPLAFSALLVLCRSQCESESSPNISFKCFEHLHWIHTRFVQMCHFAYFSSVEACLPGNTVLNVNKPCKTQMCHKVSFSIKDVWTDKL